MKRKPFLCIIVLMIAFALLFVACSNKQNSIPVPKNLSLEDNVLTWDAVTGAISYDVKVDDNVYTSEENKFTISVSDYDEHEVSVRVNTYDGTSNYSSSLVYQRRQTKNNLPQLSAPRISMTSNRVMWNTVLNNNGYKIYFDGKSYVTEKNATYYDLDLSTKKDGRYEVTMQTLGDGVSYATSSISSTYMVTVKDGKAPLQSLSQVEFTFNAEERVLEWKNRYSAEAVSYEIYQDNSPVPLVTIPADATKTRLTYAPVLTGGRVTYTMRLISNNGLYGASNFNNAITFPIADAAPADLAVIADTERNGYFVAWASCDYSDGYVVEIDGTDYPVTTDLSMKVPATLAAGRHVARVRTSGNGVYYANSLYSGGIVFYTEANGRMTMRLSTPDAPIVSANDTQITLRSAAVQNAASYRWCFVGSSGTNYLTTSGAEVILTATTVESRDATAAELDAIASVRNDLATGVAVSVVAVPSNALFASSLSSAESFLTTSLETQSIAAPEGFSYDAKGFAWIAETGTDVLYELVLDGVTHEMSAGEALSISQGAHVARIRRKGTNAMWSEEIFFRAPVDLATPAGLNETSGVLTFTGAKYANGYILYANGVSVATLYPSESMILLSTYIKTDGNYVLSLQAISSSGANSSPLSEEYLYVKTDGAYGTEAKPFAPRTAEELLSLMRENDAAYFELVSGGVYDYTNYDFSSVAAFDFSGVLLGNGATLKGIRLRNPLFNALDRATIRNLTIEIDADNFSSPQGGLLAQSAQSTSLSNMTVNVTGNVAFSRSATFGMLFYRTDELTLREVALNCDFSLNCGEACAFAAVAYNFKGNVNTLSLSGRATLRGASTRFAGLGVTGEMTVNGFTPTISVAVKGNQVATAAGCSVEGRVTASSVQSGITVSLDASNANYYGVSQNGASLSSSTLGGRVETAQATNVSLCGVGEEGIALIKNVTVSSALKGIASENAVVVGFADQIGSVDSAGSAFTGNIELTAGEQTSVYVAGIARTMTGEHAFRSAGNISLTGGQAVVSAGAISAEDLTIQNQTTLTLTSVSEARVGGAAGSASGALSVSGSIAVQATDCGDVYFGGVVENGDQDLRVENYRVSGSIAAEKARVAGVSYDARAVSFNALSLTVDLDVTSQEMRSAGALLSANSMSITGTPSLAVTIDGEGEGIIAGLGFSLGGIALSNFSVSGALSMKGNGYVFGVAQEIGQASAVSSAVSLSAEGDVSLFGLFERASSASGLTFTGNATIKSNDGEFYGLVKTVSSGRLDGGALTGVTLQAIPEDASRQSALKVLGLTDRLTVLSGANVSGVTYTIGAFDTLSFGGVATSFSDSATDGAVNYLLDSSAKQATIGGAFLEGTGRITSFTLGGNTPLRVRSSGVTHLGGMVADPGNLTVSRGASYLNYTIALPQTGVSHVGGLIAVVATNRTLDISDHAVNLTVARTGGGSALIGGVTAESEGRLQGALTEVDITSSGASDVIGGLAATSSSASIVNGLAKGKITASCVIGGLVGECSGGTVDVAATTVTIDSESDTVGGLFGTVQNATITNAYSVSRLLNKGYGFFKTGENLSMDFCYFAGEAHTYALADSVDNCAVTTIFADASLNDLSVVGSGTLDCAFRSFGYGYTSLELGGAYVADGVRYPYFAVLGYPLRNVTATMRALTAVNITGTVDLYTDLNLPRLYDAATPTITWVDDGGCLEIKDGVATVVDNGSGVLYGCLAGGARVYSVEYTASGFVPLAGEGTSESPYLIEDIRYLHHVTSYAENNPAAYFKLLIEGGVLENATFATLFTEAEPFCGTFDFNDVTLVSPVIPANGIFGYLNGATVKNLAVTNVALSGALIARSATDSTIENLSLSGAVRGDACLIGSLTDSAVDGVTVSVNIVAQTNFALFSVVSGGTIENVSERVSVNSGEDIALSMFGSVSNATVQNAQALFSVTMAGKLTASMEAEDNGSTYDSVMFIADVDRCDRAESEVAGFAFAATGSAIENSVFLTAGDMTIYPLVKEGTATCVSVNVLSDGAFEPQTGVTALTVAGARAALSLMSGYQSGDVYTPLGFDLLRDSANTPDYTFTLDEEELVLNDRITLKGAFAISGSEPLSRMVGYAYSGTGAFIQNGVLRPTGLGSGTLTLTNFYGETQTVAVTVTYDGFALGEGTYEDPYLISDFDDFKRISAYGGDFFRLGTDIAGTLSESFAFSGILDGGGYTVTVDLGENADCLFSTGSGVIENAEFIVRKSAGSVTDGGIFARSTSGMRILNSTISVQCSTVTLTDDAVFGLLFGEMSGGELNAVTVTLLVDTAVTAESGAVGLVAGSADETIIKDLSVTGNVSLTASDAVDFGVFGRLTAAFETYSRIVGEDEVFYPYADGVTLNVGLSASGDVTLGGFAGRSNVQINNVNGSVVITLTGGNVVVGGAVGNLESSLTGSALSSQIIATVTSGVFGGLVGAGSGSVQGCEVTADISVTSSADSDEVAALIAQNQYYQSIVVAGGAVGYFSGTVSKTKVTVTAISASTTYAGNALNVLAGGVAGYLIDAENVEVKGSGSIQASGGVSYASGGVAVLGDTMTFAVISGVTLSAANVGWAAVIASLRSDGLVENVYATIGNESGALVKTLQNDASINHCAYLYGAATLSVAGDVTETQKLASLEAFYATALYEEFDTDVWQISGTALPTLK